MPNVKVDDRNDGLSPGLRGYTAGLMDPIKRSTVDAGAAVIVGGFGAYVDRFRDLSRRARLHFERSDWARAQRDSARRLDLYGEAVRETLDLLAPLLDDALTDRPTWSGLRAAYAKRIADRPEADLAETFFNSLSRLVFHTVGVDPEIGFVAPATEPWFEGGGPTFTVIFEGRRTLEELIRALLGQYRFTPGYEDLEGDAGRVAKGLRERLEGASILRLETVRSPFFRSTGAYVVGRAETDRGPIPFLLALANPRGKIVVDAALTIENEVSIVFSFARSYFLVDVERPRELVAFLHAIMPRKPIAELYNAIGCNKHGKTELYRSLLRHLETTEDRFVIAPGQRGMVMCVFTLPGMDVVFKVIRDRFDPPKTATRQDVMDKYRLVFRHDRAGRLVDAQEFEHLEFDRSRFDESLLEHLLERAAETVHVEGDRVVIRHLYTERRLRPLDVYLREADFEAARDAVVDYGQVLRDLAASNIFPGDMLLKNFGVSRHGRLIFYDYDELCLLTDCNFRELPTARDDDEESYGEPWFYVGDRDIFPEEFRSFLGLNGEMLAVFLEKHEELLTPSFWTGMQDRIRSGEIVDIWPYREARRLRGPAR